MKALKFLSVESIDCCGIVSFVGFFYLCSMLKQDSSLHHLVLFVYFVFFELVFCLLVCLFYFSPFMIYL